MRARTALLLISTTLVTLAVSSCSGASVVSSTQLSRAQMAGAGSPELRTLYNTGYVYPGGQTAEVSQGVSPFVVGRGGYMMRPPARIVPLALPSVSTPSAALPSGADRFESVARVAQALCDHETTCERIGPDAVFESADACSTEHRARLDDLVGEPGCQGAVRGDLVAACLREIRAAQCTDSDPLAMPAACNEALSSCL